MSTQHHRIERLPAVCERTGLARSTLYELLAQDRFVQPVRLSSRSIGFISAEVDSWIEQRAAERPMRKAA
jgi:prophage regulatory protein